MTDKIIFADDNSETARLILSKDWSKTPLGAISTWPKSLCTAVNICLNSRFPMAVYWGENLTRLYNDAHSRILANKHPHALGANGKDVWPSELWNIIHPIIKKAFNEGKSTWSENQLFFLNRNGYREECYFTFSCGPVYDESGNIGGVLCTCWETTEELIGKRRLETISLLTTHILGQKSEDAIYRKAAEVFAKNANDFPCALIYGIEHKAVVATQLAVAGIYTGLPVFEKSIDLAAKTEKAACILKVADTHQPVIISAASLLHTADKTETTADAPGQFMLLPVLQKDKTTAVLFVGINLHLKPSKSHTDFLKLVADQISAEVTALYVRQIDIATDAVIARQKIDESEKRYNRLVQRYREVVQGLPTAVFTCNAAGKVMLYNAMAVKLWGHEPKAGEDMWFQYWKVYRMDGSLLSINEYPLTKTLNEGVAIVDEELIIERLDGSRRVIKSYPQPIFDEVGKITGAVNMLIDITESKIAEQALRESEERFRTVADTAPVMIWMTDINRNCIFINKNWSEFTGFSLEDALDKGWTSVVHPDDIKATSAVFTRAHENHVTYTHELRIKNKDGKYYWIFDHAVPRYNPKGEFLGYIGSSVNIQKDKDIQQELENHVKERTIALKNANDQLLRTNKELEQFAYVSSHDLQEPLRKIQTFSQLLSNKMMDAREEEKNFLLKITTSAQRMSDLIKDLLNFSKLSKIDEQFVDTDLNRILNNIANDFEVLIKQKNATLHIQKLPVIKAIPIQINQLFYNLVSNALKFSDKAPVIDVSFSNAIPTDSDKYQFERTSRNKKYIKLIFKDNGIGFEQKYAEQIFVIFQRLNDRTRFAGTGIGLAICKKIMENHNGFIFAESVLGQGTTFTIFLPDI